MKKLVFPLAFLLWPAIVFAAAPVIQFIAPRTGPAGTVVTITGRNLNLEGTEVNFAAGTVTDVPSNWGSSATFVVPAEAAGVHNVSVTNSDGTSNVVTFTVTEQAAGNTYYVATTGNDTTGNGSEGNPWLTIQKAVNLVQPGDTILVRGGTYAKCVLIGSSVGSAAVSGTANARITLKAYPGETVVWNNDFSYAAGHFTACDTLFIRINSRSYWTIEGFTFKRNRSYSGGFNYHGIYAAAVTAPANGIHILNNELDGQNVQTSSGIIIGFDSSTVGNFDGVVQGNIVKNWRGGEVIGVNLASACFRTCAQSKFNEYFVIRDNDFTDIGSADAGQITQFGGRYSLWENNKCRAVGVEENCFDFKYSLFTTIRNNEARDYPGDAFVAHLAATDVLWEGNIIYNSANGFNLNSVGCCPLNQESPWFCTPGNCPVGARHRVIGNLLFGLTGNGITVNGPADSEVYHNVIANAGGNCFASSGAPTLKIKNNITYECGIAYREEVINTNKEVDYNIHYDSGAVTFQCCGSTQQNRTLAQWQTFSGQSLNSTTANPLFVNPTTSFTTQDYSVQSGSPAIDMGVAIAGINPVYLGAGRDVGVYESGGAAAPTRSNATPAGTLAAGTTSAILSLTTNVTATCKYGTVSSTAYADILNTFSTTGGTSHQQTVAVSNGTTYTFYVRCQDGNGNANTNDFTITFSVANPTPTRSNGAPSGILAAGTTSVNITLNTDVASTCKYGTIANTAYASIASTFTTTGGTSHSQSIGSLNDGDSRSYFVRCDGGGGAVNNDDFTISFSIDAAPVPVEAWWKLDDGAGTTASDDSTSGVNDGTLTNGPTWDANCAVGGCVVLDGTNDYVLKTLASTYTGPFTLSVWVKANSATPPVFASVFASSGSGGSYSTFQIDTNGSGTWRVNSNFQYSMCAVTTDWQMLTITRTGSTLKTYCNGAITNTHTMDSTTEGGSVIVLQLGTNRARNTYLAGRVDDFRFYSRVLSDAEIASLYTPSATAPTAPSNLAVARSTTEDVLNVTWDDNSADETYFEIDRDLAGAGFALLASPLANVEAYAAPVTVGSTLQIFRVRACNTTGCSAYSDTAQITAPPSGFEQSITVIGNTQNVISWTTDDDESAQVMILRRTGSACTDRPTDGQAYSVKDAVGSCTVVFKGAPSNLSFVDTGLTNGVTYHYAAFRFDAVPNYSRAALVNGTPKGGRGTRADAGTATRDPALGRNPRQ